MNTKGQNANDKLRVLANTDDYLLRYEHILKEREEQDKWEKARHRRFKNMVNIV